MTNLEFLEGVRRIAASNPTYRTGGDGSDGTCDCIGLVMGAIGAKYPMHSTNYFARYELAIEPQPVTDDTELEIGDLVFKARSASNPRYDLHERYKPGGRYYNDDLLDYYHVGVVTSVAPLKITHCTSGNGADGIVVDTATDSWTHVGFVDELEYEDQWRETEKPMEQQMQVISKNGNPVKMRKTPSTLWPYIEIVPNGELVTVHELGSEWATISWGGKRGYMMRAFLHEVPEDKPKQDGQAVIISIPMDAAQALYHALAGTVGKI